MTETALPSNLRPSVKIPQETVWRFRIHEEVEDPELLHAMVEKEFDLIMRKPRYHDDPENPEYLEFNFFNRPSPARRQFLEFIETCAAQISGERFRVWRAWTKRQLPGDHVEFHAHDRCRRRDPAVVGLTPLCFIYYISGAQPATFWPYELPRFILPIQAGDLLFFRADYHHSVDMVSETRKLVNGDLELA